MAPDATVTNQDFDQFNPFGFTYPIDVLRMIADSEGQDDTLMTLEHPFTGVTMMEFKDSAGESKTFFVLYDWSRCPTTFFGYKSEQWNMATAKYDAMMKLLEEGRDELDGGRDA